MLFQVFLSNVRVSKSLMAMAPKRTVSIKRTGFKIFKIFLLNVPYDLKNFPLCNYKTSTYNRNHRVVNKEIKIVSREVHVPKSCPARIFEPFLKSCPSEVCVPRGRVPRGLTVLLNFLKMHILHAVSSYKEHCQILTSGVL